MGLMMWFRISFSVFSWRMTILSVFSVLCFRIRTSPVPLSFQMFLRTSSPYLSSSKKRNNLERLGPVTHLIHYPTRGRSHPLPPLPSSSPQRQSPSREASAWSLQHFHNQERIQYPRASLTKVQTTLSQNLWNCGVKTPNFQNQNRADSWSAITHLFQAEPCQLEKGIPC